jgi:hypothetical protein
VLLEAIGAQVIAYQGSGVSGIGTGYTAIVADTALIPGGTYALTFDADIVAGASVTPIAARVIVTTGSSGVGNPVPVPGIGSVSTVVNNANSENIDYFNAAGATGMNIFNSTTQHVILRGQFAMPVTATSVTFELATTAGTMTVAAGSFVKFTRLN